MGDAMKGTRELVNRKGNTMVAPTVGELTSELTLTGVLLEAHLAMVSARVCALQRRATFELLAKLELGVLFQVQREVLFCLFAGEVSL